MEIVKTDDDKGNNVTDGKKGIQGYQNNSKKTPINLAIDFGNMEKISGFKYLPGQNGWTPG